MCEKNYLQRKRESGAGLGDGGETEEGESGNKNYLYKKIVFLLLFFWGGFKRMVACAENIHKGTKWVEV